MKALRSRWFNPGSMATPRRAKAPAIDVASAASAMAKKRWASLSEQERKAAMDKARAARQRKVSKERRREIARGAAKARWAKAGAVKQTEKPTRQA